MDKRHCRPYLRLTILLLVASTTNVCGGEMPLDRDAGQPLESRVEDLLPRLTVEEKILLCHADSKFTSAAIPRLGIPPIMTTNIKRGLPKGETIGSS